MTRATYRRAARKILDLKHVVWRVKLLTVVISESGMNQFACRGSDSLTDAEGIA